MIKIQFLLKKPNENQESLEYITIDEPKIDKSRKFDWGNYYVCEIYMSNIGKTIPCYGINPISTLCGASEFVKIHCQGLLKGGSIIKELENKNPWLLEKLSDNFLEEEMNKIKNNPNISQEDKAKILSIIKESFSKSIIGGKLKKIIDN